MQSQIENYRAKAREFARLMIVAKSRRQSSCCSGCNSMMCRRLFLDGESINQLLLMMSRRNLPLVSIGDRAKAESHLCNYPAARDHVTLLGTVTRGDCQPIMLRLASLLKRLVQSNKPADAYSDCVDPATLAPEKTGEPGR